MNPEIERLRAQIAANRVAVAGQVAAVAALAAPSDPGTTALAAWALHHAYTAVEAILERVARALEGGVPAGPEWHRDLLEGAALDIASVRARVFAPATVAGLHELRAFRHFARHGYGAAFDPVRVAHNANRLTALAPAIDADLAAFDRFLGELSRGSQPRGCAELRRRQTRDPRVRSAVYTSPQCSRSSPPAPPKSPTRSRAQTPIINASPASSPIFCATRSPA